MTLDQADTLADAIRLPTEMIPPVEESAPEPQATQSQAAQEQVDPAPVEAVQTPPVEDGLGDVETSTVTAAQASRGSSFTLPLLCAGLALIASCVLIPQADGNRKLAYECAKLRQDLGQIQTQIKTNDEFLSRVGTDPALGERLYQRQMKYVRDGSAALPLAGDSATDTSPYSLLQIPAAPPLPEYEPVGGRLATLCRGASSQVVLIGMGLLLLAAGLILGLAPLPGRRA